MPCRSLIALGVCAAVLAAHAYPLPRFDGAVPQLVQTRLQSPLDAHAAGALALLHHPVARQHWLTLGTTPDALRRAGLGEMALTDVGSLFSRDAKNMTAGRQRAVAGLRTVWLDARAAWVRAAAAQAMATQAAQYASASEALAALARSQRAAGNLSRMDEADMLAEAATAKLTALAAQQDAQKAQMQLRAALGLDPEQAMTLAPLGDVDRRLPTLAALEALAQQHPDLQPLRAELQPDTRVADEAALRDGTPVLPLFEGGTPLGHREQRLAARLAYDSAWHALRYAVAQGRLALEAAITHWSILENERLPEVRAAADEALKYYNGMLKGVDVLIDRRRAALEATQDAIAAARDVALARIALEQILAAALPEGPEVVVPTKTPELPNPATTHHERGAHAGH